MLPQNQPAHLEMSPDHVEIPGGIGGKIITKYEAHLHSGYAMFEPYQLSHLN